ncbi:protease [Lactonifactor longoviformis]|uniref:Subtilase family protein n=1 Tax=Lactonifactor longoviformis DSM 17459 TaxID=1122155 RepID=A0A1M4ZH29_9CLOT|nr:S8 family peptidase [Lactonifactor longoviformis]POP34547.1 protease [Lactonifactor longoviformis]SHF17344.1 Subtilase family protein [Lactonifactor longoviformis DSM 17459]
MAEIRDMILDQNYGDFIIPNRQGFLENYREYGAQVLNRYYGLIHYPLNGRFLEYLSSFTYNFTPKILTLMDTVSLDASGITRVQNQPTLNLKGSSILMGFVDTGIDYTHPVFRRSDGSSRIYGIWDQTIQTGTPPEGQYYGTEYTNEQLNEALRSDTPSALVPTEDTNGHGTFLAGVAAGSAIPEEDFIGAAPEAAIAMVKLKEAKDYLKEFYFATGPGPFYQDTDIILGIRYLLSLAGRLNRALVVCIGLGTNQGSHSGESPLNSVLSSISEERGTHAVVAAGNEAGKAHHYYQSTNTNCYHEAEIQVKENTSGFTMELWGSPLETYSVGFETPLGEVVPRIPARIRLTDTIDFVLERTKIFVNYEGIQTISGGQMIFIRFTDPTPGVWRLRIYCSSEGTGNFHIWLPVSGFSDPDVIFLQPNPDTTLTTPSASDQVITPSTYNAYDGSLFLNSSRGYTRLGDIKPDIAAPGVNVFGPRAGGGFTTMTGSSVASAITSGAVALIAEWGITNPSQERVFNSEEIKTLLIRGANRSPSRLYPNREWGYGTLDVYQIFSSFSSIQ